MIFYHVLPVIIISISISSSITHRSTSPQIYQAVAPDAAVDGEKVKLQEALAEAEVPRRGVMRKPWV